MDEIKLGYVYHIKDDFFTKVNDSMLMKNKENGNYRPTYYCMKDEKSELLWVIPMSTKVDKYKRIYDKNVDKYGKCLTIVLGAYGGEKAAFLIQNMFPIIPKYIDHIHTINNVPVPVHSVIQSVINRNVKEVLQLHKRNIRIVFPNIKQIANIMLTELQYEKAVLEVAPAQNDKTQDSKNGKLTSVAEKIKMAQSDQQKGQAKVKSKDSSHKNER